MPYMGEMEPGLDNVLPEELYKNFSNAAAARIMARSRNKADMAVQNEFGVGDDAFRHGMGQPMFDETGIDRTMEESPMQYDKLRQALRVRMGQVSVQPEMTLDPMQVPVQEEPLDLGQFNVPYRGAPGGLMPNMVSLPSEDEVQIRETGQGYPPMVSLPSEDEVRIRETGQGYPPMVSLPSEEEVQIRPSRSNKLPRRRRGR